MDGHVGSACSRVCILLIGLISLGACAREGEVGALQGDLTGAAGRDAGSRVDAGGGCVPRDSIDSVPDGVDEDCDGAIDEDADKTPRDCPRGARVIEGTPGNDTLTGGGGRDCILGYGGNDIIRGYGGDDTIFGGPGDDRVYTGKGVSLVFAGSGDDLVDTSHSLLSIVYGEAGRDRLVGGGGLDKLFGGDDNDRLSGGGGPDYLSGGGCHDYLVGARSFDVSNGGDDFDACETELSSACERDRKQRSLCDDDDACPEGERCASNSGICVPDDAAPCGDDTGDGCVPSNEVDTSCDGVDDDCDGVADDDFASEATSCGSGECGSTGETSCVSGEIVDSCSPVSPGDNTDSVCDGVDSDCDGEVDEGFVATATSCGVGVCAATGERACRDGAVVDSCVAGAPSASSDSVCNGVDDDCDGAIDEDFAPAETQCGLGLCAASGVTSCEDGMLTNSCEPTAPMAENDPTCDLVDDDCDGAVDENFEGPETTCGYGACAATGRITCIEGYEIDTCEVPCEGNCADGLEDDDDGQIDCADPDCDENPAWPQCVTGQIGSGCAADSDCVVPGSRCDVGFPGGYCYSECAAGCPTGSFCYAGVACVQPCVGPGAESCPRPDHECRLLEAGGVSTPFCRPTCSVSCPAGTACTEDWQCIPQ